MDDEIQLISDGDGLAVIGDPTAVERFLGRPVEAGLIHQSDAGPRANSTGRRNSSNLIESENGTAYRVT